MDRCIVCGSWLTGSVCPDCKTTFDHHGSAVIDLRPTTPDPCERLEMDITWWINIFRDFLAIAMILTGIVVFMFAVGGK